MKRLVHPRRSCGARHRRCSCRAGDLEAEADLLTSGSAGRSRVRARCRTERRHRSRRAGRGSACSPPGRRTRCPASARRPRRRPRGVEAAGIRLIKLAMPWPLDPAELRRSAAGLDEVLVVEDKPPLSSSQLKDALYHHHHQPRSSARTTATAPRCSRARRSRERRRWPTPSAPVCPTTCSAGDPRPARRLHRPERVALLGSTRSPPAPPTSAAAAPTTSRHAPGTISWSGWASAATRWSRSTPRAGARWSG